MNERKFNLLLMMAALMSVGHGHSGPISGEKYVIPTDPTAGMDAKQKDAINRAKFPGPRERKRRGLPKPVHIPKGFHRS